MGIARTEYEIRIKSIVEALKVFGKGQPASVEIDSAGGCMVHIGVSGTDKMSVVEFAKFLDETMEND